MQCYCNTPNLTSPNKNTIIKSKYDMIDMQEAYTRIKNHFSNLSTSKITEIEILNINSEDYISSKDLFSDKNIPNSNTSMMDGYAVNSEKIDFKQVLNVTEKIYANNSEILITDQDQLINCVYLTTGSKIPSCFDCVIPIEYFEQIEYNKKIKLQIKQRVCKQIHTTS